MMGKCQHLNCGGDIMLDDTELKCLQCGRSPEAPPAHVQPGLDGDRQKRKYTKKAKTGKPPGGSKCACDRCELKAELAALKIAFENYRMAIMDLGGSHAR